MSKTDNPKKQKTTGCCCCCGGTRSKKASNYDLAGSAEDNNKDGNDDDASHITSLKNRSQSGSTMLDVDGATTTTTKSKNKSLKGKKDGKSSKNGKDRESTTLISNKPQKRKGGCRKCCMKFTTFMLSHIGLSSLVVGYSIMGAFLFQWLESSGEVQVRSDMKDVRDEYIHRLWLVTKQFNVLHEGNWTIDANSIIREFQDQVYFAVKERGWDGREAEVEEKQWSFPGALLYSVTVITTIGYGHIAPKTDMGRLATIFYALVGIPLTLLFLANIGALFGNCFRFLYKHLCIALVWLCCPNHFQQKKPSPHKKTMEKDMIHSSERSIPSIHLDNGQKEQTIFSERDTLQTLKWKASSNNALDVEEGGYSAVTPPGGSSHDGENHQMSQDYKEALVRVDTETCEPKKPKKKLKDEVRVPIFVSLLIIALYIFGGACLFSVWEKDWDYLIGSYFCFITLSTVGFGDYVFGTGSDWNDNTKLIMCALYLVFGLSIIAMTFDLMQEEVRAKFKWLGAKLGMIQEGD